MNLYVGNGSVADWQECEPLLKSCLDRIGSEHSIEDMRNWVLSRRDLLWQIVEDGRTIAAAVTQMILDPKGNKACCIFAMGGRGFSRWGLHALAEIERYAKANGCKSVTLKGRKAWQRILPEYAFDGDWYERAV